MGFFSSLFGSKPKDRVITAIDAATLEGAGRRRKIDIVGEYYREDALIAIAGPKTERSVSITTSAVLLPDPKHKLDRNAVEVRIEGRHVGYLSREQAIGYHSMMAGSGNPGRALANIEARIYGGRIFNGEPHTYQVAIYLPESLAKQIGFLETQ